MLKYAIQVPGWAYSMTCYGYNKRDAVKRFRDNQGFGKRMPKGYAIWLCD